jgi:hypothetical protein
MVTLHQTIPQIGSGLEIFLGGIVWVISSRSCLSIRPSRRLAKPVQVVRSLGVAAQEIRTGVCRVGVGVKAPARFDAQPALVDVLPFDFVGYLLDGRVA